MYANTTTRWSSLVKIGLSRRTIGTIVALLIGATMVALFWNIQRAAIVPTSKAVLDIAHLVRMTTIQAGLTTILSITIGIALAWALNRLSFPGRGLVVGLFSAAIVTPGVVVSMGLLQVWGRAGWVNQLLAPLGIDLGSSIFGLQGILLAHVVLDATFAARILLARFDAIPTARLRSGQSLGLSPWTRFTTIDWPAISGALSGLSTIIFLIAFTSFPIVLLLGGGPANQTIEVAIYTFVRLNFDLAGAVQLALVQLVICAIVILPAIAAAPSLATAGISKHYNWSDGIITKTVQVIIVVICLAAFVLPLASVLISGFGPDILAAMSRNSFWLATGTSLIVGTASAFLVVLMSISLTMARIQMRNRFWRTMMNFSTYAYLVIPAVVLSLGFFLTSRNLGISPSVAAPFVLVFANALLALPFAISTIGPALEAIDKRYGRLATSLGMNGLTRWQRIEWPLLGREIGIVSALGFCFSLGDLGVISLFGTEDFATLPWLMVRAMGSYRTNDAAAIAAILLFLSLAMFWALPAIFGKISDVQN